MTSTISYRTTDDGVTLLERHWVVDAPQATVVLVHGLGEHSGRYEHVAAHFTAAGFAVSAFDLRSFGRSGGRPRSHVDDFDLFLDDLEEAVEAAASSRPVVVLGHSMGGLIAVAYAATDRRQPDAYVVSAPPLQVDAPRWQRVMSRLLTRWLPHLSIANGVDSATLSRDVAVQQAYDADPLVQRDVTVRLGAEMFAAMDRTSAALDRIDVPMLVLHGAEDELVAPRFSAALGGVACVRRELLDGLRHEIFNEPEQTEVLGRVVDWIGTVT